MNAKNIKYGQARVQFFALVSEVKDLFEKGYTARTIYEEFTGQEKITMSYRTFSRYVRTMIKKINKKSKIVKTEVSVQEKNEKQEAALKKFSAPEKKKGFGSGLHKDADEVC